MAVALVGVSPATAAARTLSHCTANALRAAVAAGGSIKVGCSGTISLARPLQFSGGKLIIDATGRHLDLVSSAAGEGTRLFAITDGKVTLINLTFRGALAGGGGGNMGSDGDPGKDGRDGGPLPNINGTSGLPGEAGGNGTNGHAQSGGAVAIGPAATVILNHCSFIDDAVAGGNGGDGGKGANGGRGGNGTNLLGGNGGSGGAGGDGGDGGNGGAAKGGAIYNEGKLTIVDSSFSGSSAIAGNGGKAGAAGSGGPGGQAGTEKTGDQVGDGGAGGEAGFGGNGGAGGIAVGAAIYNAGTLSVSRTTFTGSRTIGGKGGDGAAAGSSAPGGKGGDSLPPMEGVPGGDGGSGGVGGDGGAGGKGGSALGAAIFSAGPVSLDGVKFNNGSGVGGDGGAAVGGTPGAGGGNGGSSFTSPAGKGGNGGQGGDGGNAGGGGGGGAALGGAVFSGAAISATNVTSRGNSVKGGKGDPEQGAAGGAGGAPGTGNPNGNPGAQGAQGADGKDGANGAAAGTNIIGSGIKFTPTTTGALKECPPVGDDTSCGALIVIGPNGAVSGSYDPNQGPYDGDEDTLVGVVNQSSSPVDSIQLTGPDIFGFDGDGLCTFITCTWPAPTGYEGPKTSFAPIDSDTGTVNFTGGLAPGASTYFSLEGTSLLPCRIDETHLGWHFEGAQANVDTGAKNITVTKPSAWAVTVPSLITYALPVSNKCQLALPIVLPDINLDVGPLSLHAVQNSIDDSGLTIGQASFDTANASAIVRNLNITPDFHISADELELTAFGASLTADNIKFDPAAGMVTAKHGTIALPEKLGNAIVGIDNISISKSGITGTLESGAFDIGDIRIGFKHAEFTPTGFKIDSADVELPPYLGGAKLHGEGIVYDANANTVSVKKASGTIDFTVAGGKLKIHLDGAIEIRDDGTYSIVLNGSAEIPSYFRVDAGIDVESIKCADIEPPATTAPCTNARYLHRADLSIKGVRILLGSTGLALGGFGFHVLPGVNTGYIDTAGDIHGPAYTFKGETELLTAADNGFTFDGELKGVFSSNGNFGVGLDGTMFRFVTLGGHVCVRLTDVPGDDICGQLSPYLAGQSSTGIFIDTHAGAQLTYSGSLGTAHAILDAHALGRFIPSNSGPYIDATVGGGLDVAAHSWLLPDIVGSAKLTAQLGRFTTPSNTTTLGIKGTVVGDLRAKGTLVDTHIHVERSVFIDQNLNYTEDNVDAFAPAHPNPDARHVRAHATAGPTTYGFDVPRGETQTLATVRWAPGAAPASLTLISPRGVQIDARLDSAGPEIAITTPGRHPTKAELESAYVTRLGLGDALQVYLPVPTAGHWEALVGNTTGAALNVTGNRPTPRLAVSAGNPRRGLVRIHGASSARSVALYASRGRCGRTNGIISPNGTGLPLGARVPVRQGHFTWQWRTAHVSNGRYTVYAVANDGTGPLVRACSPTTTTVHHPAKRPSKKPPPKHAQRGAPAQPILTVPVPPVAVAQDPAPPRAEAAAASLPIPTLEVDSRTPNIALNDYAGITGHFPNGEPAYRYVDARTDPTSPWPKGWPKYRCPAPGGNCKKLVFIRFSGSGKSAAANRRAACGRQPFKNGADPGPPPPNPASYPPKKKKNQPDSDRTSCDEFPFASTTAGGMDDIVMGVTIKENRTQGGIISQFVQQNDEALTQHNGEFYVCVKIAGKQAGRC